MAPPNKTENGAFKFNSLDLSRDSIRLIRLQSGRPDDPVVCDLLEVLLGDTDGVPYSALSYTWGDSSMTRSIRLDGAHFEVTSNLYGALHNLRRQTEDRYLWVDAVCIDQNNTNKRNHQVGQMRRVYQYAESVIIWLGGSTCDIDQLLDSVNDLDRRLLEDEAPTKLVRVDRARYVWEWKINSSAKDKEDFSRRSRYAMEALLLRPWFNRIWVIQEAASAKTAAIACGQNSVPTRTFALMPELLGITPHERATALLEAMPGPLRRLSWWNEKPNLETLLRKFHGCDATDPRDKIYALLGIAADASGSKTTLKANYQLDFQETLSETFSFLIFGKVIDLTFFKVPHHMLTLDYMVDPDGALKSRFQRWIDESRDLSAEVSQLFSGVAIPRIRRHPPHITSPSADWEAIPLPPPLSTRELDALIHNHEYNPTNTTHDGCRLFLQAAANGQVVAVTSLLANFGRDIALKRSDQIGALGLAARWGHLTCVQAIMSFDDTPSHTEENRWNYHPFNLAAKTGRIDVMKEFINSSDRSYVPSREMYERSLAEAARYGHSTTVVKLLVDTLVSQLSDSQPLDGFCFRYTLILHTWLLHSAIKNQKTPLAMLLLDMGADFNKVDEGETAISLVVKHKNHVLIRRMRELGATKGQMKRTEARSTPVSTRRRR